MKAYHIFNDNLDTIKQYIRNPDNSILILDLSNDSVFINVGIPKSHSVRVLATKDVKDLEEVRQTIIYWLWEEADTQETQRKMKEFADNVPNFDIDDDEEFVNIDDV